ncbi:hypothetical protein [Arthrobacter cryoconiti]|uniref:Uncharacterized protein n=1 Tax=Arthrobacter cryoconiti TaxID=748907 RepID=A0ABV8QWK7_9MICC|nr:hypothetical protein [Arthrobacter cryoconiti]MCC9067313.1 hypothetical protein [Arthrobacter cryoconiti]
MVNRQDPLRIDVPFMRRRVKQTPASSTAAVADTGQSQRVQTVTGHQQPQGLHLRAPSSSASPHALQPATVPSRSAPVSGLSLARNSPASSASSPSPELDAVHQGAKVEKNQAALLFPAPKIRDTYELNLNEQVLRLTALESAVGTLVVSGSTAVAWESVRHVVGAADVLGNTAGTPIMTAGNRALVGYEKQTALIPLRHIRELRRAIFINRGNSPMGVQIFNGASVAIPPPANGVQFVLLAHRIANLLELRAEPVPIAWTDQQIWQEFDFTMTHQAPVSNYRR